VCAVVAALETAHKDGALGEIEIIPTKVAGLAHPQAMTVDQEAEKLLNETAVAN
jgi:hypothetical protein